MNFKAVVFDMDGVIFDSERAVRDCWKIIADRYDIPDIETTYMACLGVNAPGTKRIMQNRYGDDFPYDAYRAEASSIFHSRYGNGRLPMKPGVTELLSTLRARGVLIALASSTRREVVVEELTDAGIISYFHKIICGDMVEKSKPAPDIFRKACEELQVAPEDAYAIEDSYNGIRSAQAAGLHPIMVPDLSEPTKEMERLSEIILPSLAAVMDYLFSK